MDVVFSEAIKKMEKSLQVSEQMPWIVSVCSSVNSDAADIPDTIEGSLSGWLFVTC